MGQKYAAYNSAGNVIAYYDSVDSPVPQGVSAIPITNAQWQSAINSPYPPSVSNGALVIPTGPTLAQAQASQIATIQSAAQSAEQAPLSFTNTAGTTSAFPMDQPTWAKYLGAYTKYVVHSQPIPGGGTTIPFYDVNDAAVPMTLTDIANFYNAGEAQIMSAMAKFATLKAQINAPGLTVAQIQAIVW